jgi:hypothetical protein
MPREYGLFPFIHDPHQFLIAVKGQINLDPEPINLFIMAAQGIQIIYEFSIKVYDVLYIKSEACLLIKLKKSFLMISSNNSFLFL